MRGSFRKRILHQNKRSFTLVPDTKWRLESLLVSRLTLNTELADEINPFVYLSWERKEDCQFRSHLETAKITFALW